MCDIMSLSSFCFSYCFICCYLETAEVRVSDTDKLPVKCLKGVVGFFLTVLKLTVSQALILLDRKILNLFRCNIKISLFGLTLKLTLSTGILEWYGGYLACL